MPRRWLKWPTIRGFPASNWSSVRDPMRSARPMPNTENGHYSLSPVADGVIRLDTRTGAVSTCSNTGMGWACYATPDERAALDVEIGRRQAEMANRMQKDVTGKI